MFGLYLYNVWLVAGHKYAVSFQPGLTFGFELVFVMVIPSVNGQTCYDADMTKLIDVYLCILLAAAVFKSVSLAEEYRVVLWYGRFKNRDSTSRCHTTVMC